MLKLFRLVLIVASALLAGFVLWAVWPGAAGSLPPVAAGGRLALALLTALAGLTFFRHPAGPAALRRAWLLLAAACLTSAVADALALAGAGGASPSLADLFNLLAYPPAFAALLAFPYAPLTREKRWVLLTDIGIVVVVVAVVLWQGLGPRYLAQTGQGLSTALIVAYPLGDLLLLAGLVVLVQREVLGVERRVLLALAGGLALLVLADGAWAFNIAPLDGPASPLLHLAWLTGRWAVLVAAVWQLSQTRFDPERAGRFAPLLSTTFLFGAILIIIVFALVGVVNVLRTYPLVALTLAGSRLLTLLVVLRQFFMLQENRRLARALEKLAVTDALTGLANRRALDETLAREIIRAQRYHRPFSLLLLDIDDFKQVNDRRGHLAGDQVLKTLASLIRTQLRASDFAARYGGDEFVVILPECDATVARSVAEKLDAAIRGILSLDHGPTVSIGRAAFQPKLTAHDLLELADQDMYRTKAGQAGPPPAPDPAV
ncbi:MAG: GGDEF domain-containing protein [Anaerolineales bacterium]|nr:GGDEF domain-containing protein [Anaerolineales bacterium]